jgi:hypothetical protein
MESAGGTGAAISATPSFSMEEIDRNGDTKKRKKESQTEDLLCSVHDPPECKGG